MPGLEEMIQALAGSRPVAPPPAAQMAQALAGPTMTDADPFNFMPGQQYAMMDEELRKQGKVAPQLADQFGGASPVAPKAWQPPPHSPNTPWTPENTQRLIELRTKNIPVKDIANELGLTKGQIMGRLNREGLTDSTNLGGDRRSPKAVLRESQPRQQPSLPRLKFLEKPFTEE